MKLRTALLSVLCVLLILCIPCVVSFGAERTDIETYDEERGDEAESGDELDFWGDDDEEEAPEDEEDDLDFWSRNVEDAPEKAGGIWSEILNVLIPSASAEETEAAGEDPYALPMDISVGGMVPDDDCYIYKYDESTGSYQISGYRDDSITVEVETIYADKVIWRIARVQIKSPTQIRTGIAGSKVSGKKTAVPTSIAKKYNAVIAMNGDDYQQQPDAKSFEYRMGLKVRSKSNAKRDILIIDENGDLNIFVKSDAAKMKEFAAAGHKPVNAFTFGPALVIDGELQEIPKDYKYNPNMLEPRSAIGQTGELSYVLVVAETLTRDGSQGVTVAELADFMLYQMGCKQAYNLDGGNTAEMVFNNKMYMDKKHAERDMYDIIYFATSVDSTGRKD